MATVPRPPIERFMDKVDQSGECWLWTAALFDNGYGAFRDGPQRRAHRWAYEHFIGAIPEGMRVLHTCDIPRCVNPAHLWLGTDAENQQDKVRKGRKYAQKLSFATAEEIRRRRRRGERQSDLAVEYGVSRPTISGITRGRYYKQ